MRPGDEFKIARPRGLKDALERMAEAVADGRSLVPLAGGTDLYVQINAGQLADRRFIDLWDLNKLRGIERDGRRLTLGALTTYTDCIRSPEVARLLPILAAAAREVGGVQIQNRGTLAGNRHTLERYYKLGLEGRASRWTLTLTPADSRMAAVVSQVRIDGSQDALDRVEIRQADGDRSVMTIRPAGRP